MADFNTTISQLKARLEANLAYEPNTGCWLWTGNPNRDGYGKTKIDGKTVLVHRLSWLLSEHEDPGDLFVLHKCDVPCCVNPAHLFLGTQADNVADRVRKGRSGKRGLTPHCKRGHQWTEKSSYYHHRSDGRILRACSICRAAYKKLHPTTWRPPKRRLTTALSVG